MLRGRRVYTEQSQNMTTVRTIKPVELDQWSKVLITFLSNSGYCIGIFSDFPQPELLAAFTHLNVHHIGIGSENGTLKPLPDVCFQLMSQLGVHAGNTYLIGDGLRTDKRSIFAVGGHFIPIQEIRNQSMDRLQSWIV